MPYERNVETKEALKQELKAVQASCLNVCQVISNAPLDQPSSSHEEVNEKMLCYLEGLRTEIHNSNTPISSDENLLTAQFLNDIKEKTSQVEELTALINGNVHDLNAETNRLISQIKITQEAKSRPRAQRREVRPEHIQKAKERFIMMKNELHSLIDSLFPNPDELMELMGQLMSAKASESSSGYIQLTSENFHVVELLRDLNIVTTNPYNNMEIKLRLD